MISKDDILRLANKWNTDLRRVPDIHKKEKQYVPVFVQETDVKDSDIRVWFRGESDSAYIFDSYIICSFGHSVFCNHVSSAYLSKNNVSQEKRCP